MPTKMQLRQRMRMKDGVPIVDKILLRGGLQTRNLRREIKRYHKEVQKYDDEEILEKPILRPTKFIDWRI